MLDISNAKIAQVIMLSREGKMAEGQLHGFIANLNEDEQASLVAVMWIGREDFDPEDLAEAKRTALAEASAPTEEYLSNQPLLADYLESGLDALGVDVTEAEADVMRR
ncbi:conserved hypothetical protein [Dinoroseobacter shibae DFL 12 = DSM 16493]|jgi:hypothetical protein|uniref:DUF3775 domain-containing protein n=1 Tax=Dinoroseobacter shibae (strain DSM 16493 / NCIMB 14021 / DFL 12) TaxID=398580 RepID=A8LMX7_DINSH|nr:MULTISPECIES: DUF3775 domain-containing protein [Dinoroseobacter]ABV92121.1 conserved hypothetical protein [Dinoroseobacter shibae DFL 12 = DSM 16493]MDD9718915.1 DUF3775 domain-containing protein [Dinoroseobacter sp. PD6]URF47079.1 DUF3775 domain-containing protein [Dinoroseobacter shibae]URF51390.1 DUF3775 domain-containing protein [Dinoroseobacter shibae]